MAIARCDNCGAPLELATGATRVRCVYCEVEQTVSALVVATTHPAVTPREGHRAGQRVLCEWRGSWWPATVLDVLADGDVLVHYDGYSSAWDERVPPHRLGERPAVAAPRRLPVVAGVIAAVAALALVGAAAWHRLAGADPSAVDATGARPAAPASLKPGQAVLARWRDEWWRASVLAVNADGTVRVRYEGWSSRWDEDVTLDRLRVP